MSNSFSSASGFFIISWKNKGQKRELSVTVHNFIKAMKMYLKLKVDRAELSYFPQDGRAPIVIRRRR